MNNVLKGHYYEDMAAGYLSRHGYCILARNYRCRGAEIDIIAKDKAYLVFIEVKYRKDADKQHPLEAVDLKKQQHICKAAVYYMHACKYGADQPCRFDVVAIINDKPAIYKDAFSFQYGKGW